MPWVAALIFVWVYCFTVSIVKVFPYISMILAARIFYRTRLAWLYGLPLSRRAVLWMTLGATAAPFLAGVATATWVHRPSFLPLVRPRVGEFMSGLDSGDLHLHWTNVPLEYWRHAPGGKIPSIEAPWGERVVPHSLSILGFVMYNPYTATKMNSDRFFEWQFENATQELSGRRISFERYQQIHYNDTPDYPQHQRVDLVAFVVLTFWLTFVSYLMELTASRPTMGTPIILLTGGGWYFVNFVSLIALPGTMAFDSLLQALFMRVAALPLPTRALAAIGAAPCLAMYLLLDWQSRRSEIVNLSAATTSL